MKLSKFLTLAICFLPFFLSTNNLKAQEKMSCCVTAANPTEAFAALGNDRGFRKSHDNPEPFTLEDAKGNMFNYATPDGSEASAYYIKAKGSKKYLFVIHEWWGLNDYIKREADKLAEAMPDVHIVALDIYDGKVADNREDASALMQAVTEERAKAIIEGAIEYAGKDAEIGTIGWCFGGGWSLKASLLAGDQGKACVIYYGMPVRNAGKLKPLNAPVLGIFASKDGWINPEVVGEFESAMKEVGKSLVVHMYDAEHAFANPSNPAFDNEASRDAWTRTLAFLKANL